MANTVGQNAVSIFTSPINGTAPIDADQVRGNDNTIRFAYNLHDADSGIHLQSSTLAQRPAAGTTGRKWVTADAGSYKLWFDDGTRWHEVGNDHIEVEALADENLVKGDVVSVTGYNVGLNIVRVAKYDGTSPAFGVANETIGIGTRGYVINTGLITGIDTTGYGTVAEPAILFPSDTTNFTATKPVSGEYQVVAFLLRNNSTNGVLYVEFSAPRIVERSDNTVNTLVLRDGSGNFSAGTITASLTGNVTGDVTGNITGNAGTATALQNVRTLWGQNFDGTANVSGSLTGVTDITASGTITATTLVGSVATAATAVKLSSARTFALTGDVTGTTSSDLDTGFSISTTVASIPAGLITNTEINATAAIAYSKLALTGSIVDADVSATAAIAYSKLALSSSIVDADVSATAAIAYSKLSLSNSIVDADINASAAIAYSKLSLSGSIVDADVSSTAAIAYSKLALAGSIVDADINASAAIAYSKLALSGSIVNADISATAAIAYSKLALTGSVVNADISASAGIVDTKLATISTAGKVSNSATTATASNTNNAIVARDGSGNFSAGTVTASLSGNATTATTATQVANALTAGSFLTATGTFNGSTARTFAVDATDANTASKVVARNASGNFSAGEITAVHLTLPPTTLGTTGTINIDFAGAAQRTQAALTGNITYTASNYAAGRAVTIRVINGSTQRTFTFPTNWVFVGEKPANIAANKRGILTITSFGTTEADCIAAFAVQT
jgi:hypothetical protein